jgi:hypothetical protein
LILRKRAEILLFLNAKGAATFWNRKAGRFFPIITTHAELAALERDVVAVVLQVHELFEQLLARQFDFWPSA